MTCDYFPYQRKRCLNQLNNMKMAIEVQLASALNKHQVRKLCCVKREVLVID